LNEVLFGHSATVKYLSVCLCLRVASCSFSSELSDARRELSQLRARIATLNTEAADHKRHSSSLTDELNAARQQITFITAQLESSRTLGINI